MNLEEAKKLINSTYVLTARERDSLLNNFKLAEPNTLKILGRFKENKNVNDFYADLKNHNLLSTNNTYIAYMKRVNWKQSQGDQQEKDTQKENITPENKKVRRDSGKGIFDYKQYLSKNLDKSPRSVNQKIARVPKMEENYPKIHKIGTGDKTGVMKNVSRLAQLLCIIPLTKVPIFSLFNNLCGPGILECPLEHFKKCLIKFFGHKVNQIDPSVVEELFGLLDQQHDGKIDINELGKGLGVFYKTGRKYREFLSIWKVVSLSKWIPAEVMVVKLYEATGCNIKVAEDCVNSINLEDTPNVTFWQFLRSVRLKGCQKFINLVLYSGLVKLPPLEQEKKKPKKKTIIQKVDEYTKRNASKLPQMVDPAKNLAQIEFNKVTIENPTTKAQTETEIPTEIYSMPKIYSEESMDPKMANAVGISAQDKPISSPSRTNLQKRTHLPHQVVVTDQDNTPQIYHVPRMYSGPINNSQNSAGVNKLKNYNQQRMKEGQNNATINTNTNKAAPKKLKGLGDVLKQKKEIAPGLIKQTPISHANIEAIPQNHRSGEDNKEDVKSFPNYNKTEKNVRLQNKNTERQSPVELNKDNKNREDSKSSKTSPVSSQNIQQIISKSQHSSSPSKQIINENSKGNISPALENNKPVIYEPMKNTVQSSDSTSKGKNQSPNIAQTQQAKDKNTPKKSPQSKEKSHSEKLQEIEKVYNEKERQLQEDLSQAKQELMQRMEEEINLQKQLKMDQISKLEGQKKNHQAELDSIKSEMTKMKELYNSQRKALEEELELEKQEAEKAIQELRRSTQKVKEKSEAKKKELQALEENQSAENQKNTGFSRPPLSRRLSFKNEPQITLTDPISARIPLELNNVPAEKMARILKAYFDPTNGEQFVTLPNFRKFMEQFKPKTLHPSEFSQYCKLIFENLDFNEDGTCDKTELSNFLILVSGGNKTDKIKAAFDFYDQNGDHNLSISELCDYFKGVLKLKMNQSYQLEDGIDKSQKVDLLAASMAKKVFTDFGKVPITNSKAINLQEFVMWVENKGKIDQNSNVVTTLKQKLNPRTKLVCTKQEHDLRLQNSLDNLDQIRESIPFQNIHISSALRRLERYKPSLVTLTKEELTKFLNELLKKENVQAKFKNSIDSLGNFLFQIWDDQGHVSKRQICMFFFTVCGKCTH